MLSFRVAKRVKTFFKHFRRSNKFSTFFKFTKFISTKSKQIFSLRNFFLHLHSHTYMFNNYSKKFGNIEFALFFSALALGLYLINLNKSNVNETIRLIGAGITTHIAVEFVTYIGDKINTKVKVDHFKEPKSSSTSFQGIKHFFDERFSPYKINKFNPNAAIWSDIRNNPFTLFQFKGIQAATVFVVINSLIFYGLYKNMKAYLKDKFGLDGFLNFFIASGFAQFVAMLFAFPLENIKTRMQASNFTYDSFYKYYKNLFVNKPLHVIKENIKIEYSGFVSHLVLYVVYEAVSFGIYESMMKLNFGESNGNVPSLNDNEIVTGKCVELEIERPNLLKVFISASISGIVAGIITNPIDVYQINKQINPNFSIFKMDRYNIRAGIRERIAYITVLNLATFIFLENISTKYFKVKLE
jgi:hypothetical protein